MTRRLDRKTPRQEPHEVPEGHSVPAHGLFGWCAACPGHLLSDEIVAWRQFAGRHLDELRELPEPT